MSRNPTTLMSLQSEDTFDFLFKIVLIGDCGTGKTCVVQRFKNGTFVEKHGNTIGVDFSMKTVMVDGKKVKVTRSIALELFKTSLLCLAANMGHCRTREVPNNNTKLLQICEWCNHSV